MRALFFAGLLACAGAAHAAGYLVDAAGQPVRTGSGPCVRTGSWAPDEVIAACDPVRDRIVLLPGPDGRAGKVLVSSGGRTQTLDTAYAGALVSREDIVARQEEPERVARRYGELLAAQPARPRSYVVHFATGSVEMLNPESLPVIEELKRDLAGRAAPEVTVIGHTDRVGSLEDNDALSLQRAETVRKVLVEAGVRADSIDIAGRGEREPAVATADEVDEPRNRRVEISVR